MAVRDVYVEFVGGPLDGHRYFVAEGVDMLVFPGIRLAPRPDGKLDGVLHRYVRSGRTTAYGFKVFVPAAGGRP
jgi:hypothetical protein